MMKYFKIFTTLLILALWMGCSAQQHSNLIVDQKGILIEEYPIYHDLKNENKGNEYLDSLIFDEITYLSDGLKVKAFVIQPKSEGKYPCIIFNRGGNLNFGAWNPSGVIRFLGAISKEGYVVIASQYRGNGGGEGIEEFGGADVNDVTILPKVLGEIKRADTTRIGMYGWSRGGMMTYMALQKMRNIKAAVVGGGVTNHFELIKERPKMEELVYARLIPNYKEQKEQELTDRSVIFWADRLPRTTPILLMHGGADWRVRPNQTLSLALELEKVRIPYRLIIYEGDDHGLSQHKMESHQQAMDWFERYVKNGEELPEQDTQGN